MAAPITHIVLANKVFDNFFSKFEKDNFFIGTSFPDIRYLKVIDRDTTHFKNIELNVGQLNLENSFVAGAKVHAIVDEIRENYIIANKTYEFLPKSKYATQSLKLLEDELLYDKINFWGEIVKDFEHIPYEMIHFELEKKHIENWYSLLREYFSREPTPEIRAKFITKIGFKKEDAEEMNKFIAVTKSDEKIRQIIYGFFERFDMLLKEFAAQEQNRL